MQCIVLWHLSLLRRARDADCTTTTSTTSYMNLVGAACICSTGSEVGITVVARSRHSTLLVLVSVEVEHTCVGSVSSEVFLWLLAKNFLLLSLYLVDVGV